MVNIYLNGKKKDIDEGMSISDLLSVNNIRPEVVVVEVNEKIIERDKYKDTILSGEDKVEFVYYMGGGEIKSGGCRKYFRSHRKYSFKGIIDEIIKVDDNEAFKISRRLAKEEGLLVGMSAGAAVSAALKVAKRLGRDKLVIVILPDTGDRYFSMEQYFEA